MNDRKRNRTCEGSPASSQRGEGDKDGSSADTDGRKAHPCCKEVEWNDECIEALGLLVP